MIVCLRYNIKAIITRQYSKKPQKKSACLLSDIFSVHNFGWNFDLDGFSGFAVFCYIQQCFYRLYPDMPRVLIYRRYMVEISNSVNIAETAYTYAAAPCKVFAVPHLHNAENYIVAVCNNKMIHT